MMQFSGTLKQGGAYEVSCKDGSKKVMISFTVADEIGNTFACQMWPDDQQHGQLSGVIASCRMQPVQFTVAGYTSRLRKFKDGKEQPQTNFVVTNVVFPNLQQA